MKVLVTGADGFLGRHLVQALLARGHSVRALVLPRAALAKLDWPASVEVVRADLRSAPTLEPAFDGVDVLVHLAAALGGTLDHQLAITVGGTERLLAAMARTGCRRLVLASSFAVYDWSAIRGTLDEASPLEPAADLERRDPYAIAKARQEQLARAQAARHGWDLTVLRPGFLWGRDRARVAAFPQPLGPLHLVIGPLTRLPLTHVENCADLFARAVEDPRARGETFNVVDGPGPRAWTQLGAHLRGAGAPGIRIPVPYSLAFALVRLAYATVLGRFPRLPNLLVPCRFEARLKPLRFGHRRARELLGWTPPLDPQACLERTYPRVTSSPALERRTRLTA